MLTRKNLIEIGTSVITAMNKEIEFAGCLDDRAKHAVTCAARSQAVKVLADLFYMANHKVRLSFQCSYDEYCKACGWVEQ